MAVNFNKYSNVMDMDSYPFSSIVFGENAPLLEVELNEMQQIFNKQLYRLSSAIAPCIIPLDDKPYELESYSGGHVELNLKNLIFIDKKGRTFYLGGKRTLDCYVHSDVCKVYVCANTTTFNYNSEITEHGFLKSDIATGSSQISNPIIDGRVGIETTKREATTYQFYCDLHGVGAIPSSAIVIGSFYRNSGNDTVEFVPNEEVWGSIPNRLLSIKKLYGDTNINIGRQTDTEVGQYSTAVGFENTASGDYSYAEGFRNTAKGFISHAEGAGTKAEGEWSHAEGQGTTAQGNYSHVEGYNTKTVNEYSHAEGNSTTAIGVGCHVEGYNTTAIRTYSHAEGDSTTASGEASHSEGNETSASGNFSHAEGYKTTADSDYSHAEGRETYVSSTYGHAEGSGTQATGILGDHAEGLGTTASGSCSHAEGQGTTASGMYAHAEGQQTKAMGSYAHAEGAETLASGNFSHAEGYKTTALQNQHAQGHFNDTSLSTENTQEGTSEGTAFVIGNGIPFSPSNAFRITGSGKAIGKASFASSGADYAEYFEWQDGNPDNEDRVGYFVTFADGRYIKKANEGDYILGVVSGMPCIIGNNDECWMKQFEMDDFGRFIYETKKETYTTTDIITGEEKTEEREVTFYKVNPDYDKEKQYVHRENRQEWGAVGMFGVLSVYDDGTCKVNGYCKCSSNGVATASDTGYRVIERVRDNIVKVVIK